MSNATQILRKLGDEQGTEIKARHAIQALLNEFGGYQEWARQVALDMEAAPMGGTVRASLHRLFVNAIMRFDMGSSADDDEPTDQIEATVRDQLKQLEAMS